MAIVEVYETNSAFLLMTAGIIDVGIGIENPWKF